MLSMWSTTKRRKRTFFQLNAVSLTFTLGAIGFVLLALAAITVLPAVANGLAGDQV